MVRNLLKYAFILFYGPASYETFREIDSQKSWALIALFSLPILHKY